MKLEKDFSNKSWLLRFVLYGTMAILVLVLVVYARLSQLQKISPPPKQTSLPAFPGAEGFGTSTPGGRHGRIIFVTNLNDTTDVNSLDYVGSLRWALEHTWPMDSADPYSQRRMIIFKVGGVISLVDRLILTNPFVTIAGQTAPGEGITLKGSGMIIATHDVIVRGVRVRVGDQGQPTCCLDGINISTTHASSDVYNIVVDHSSVSWSIDENISTWIDPKRPFTAHDITIQWSIISEGLHNSIHLDEGATETDPHSMGAILGQDGTNMTVHHNLFAHNWARNPRISGIINSEIINNVIYGWGNAAVEINSDKNITHILNNYFKADLNSSHEEIVLSDHMHLESWVYIDNNLTYDFRDSERLIKSRIKVSETFKIARKYLFDSSNVTMNSPETVYEDVLNFAGVTYPVRDLIDQRIVDEVRTGTGNIIDSQDQVGAWPNYQTVYSTQDTDDDGIPNEWELAHGLDPNFSGDAGSFSFRAPSGYSWIEEYINSLITFPSN
ncbi:MAG: hypothetical protein HZB50_14565 [Chloroflexi bacterium]|nr:hypothetical protein [Chloroflexota bacterium]